MSATGTWCSGGVPPPAGSASPSVPGTNAAPAPPEWWALPLQRATAGATWGCVQHPQICREPRNGRPRNWRGPPAISVSGKAVAAAPHGAVPGLCFLRCRRPFDGLFLTVAGRPPHVRFDQCAPSPHLMGRRHGPGCVACVRTVSRSCALFSQVQSTEYAAAGRSLTVHEVHWPPGVRSARRSSGRR